MKKVNILKNNCTLNINEYIKRSVHFIGIGGIGMSALAKYLLEQNYSVSGSDLKESKITDELKDMGANILISQQAENTQDAALVIVSSAITDDNPEYIEAVRRRLPILHRSQLLNMLMNKEVSGQSINKIGVAGTHGKTTTSGMIVHMLHNSQSDPSFVVGGMMPELNTNSKYGKGDFFVAELDESDGTIVNYSPNISIITNLELDHVDHYQGGFDEVLETFKRFILNHPPKSKIILNIDCPGSKRLLQELGFNDKFIFYSTNAFSEAINYTVKCIEVNGFNSSFELYKFGHKLGRVTLSVPGLHNISNATAAIAASMESGISFAKAAYTISSFTGMGRRFQKLGEVKGATIVDDYAHHPSEILSTLEATNSVKESLNKGKIVAIFQPHRYSRFKNLWDEFTKSFKLADKLIVCDVYPAGEAPVENTSSADFINDIIHKDATYIPGSIDSITETIYNEIEHDDIVLTLGAGDITRLGKNLLQMTGD